MFETREIYRAIGELAYVIAQASDGVRIEEKKAFYDIIEEKLDFNAWAAESRFQILDEKVHPTIDHAYNEAIHELKLYKKYLTPELKSLTLEVVKTIAQAYGATQIQEFIIDRLQNDLKNI